MIDTSQSTTCPICWGCRIHRLRLRRRVRHPANECPGYDIKPSDSEAPVTLDRWRIRSTPTLTSLTGPFWPGVGAPNRVLSKGQIEVLEI